MDVYIDNEPFTTEAASLAAIIDAARPGVLASGRLIVEIRLDGRSLDDQEMEQLAERDAPGAELQLVTSNAAELCLQALLDVRQALDSARQAQRQAAEKLQADQSDAAFQDVPVALGAWQQCQQAVGQTSQLLNIPLEDLTVDDRPATDIVQDLADRLTVTREQLVGGDWLGLADSLAYELDAAAEEWDRLLGVMIDRVEQMRPQ